MNLLQMKKEMELAGYTFEHLSELSGISVDVIQKLFSGEIESPSYELLAAIEKALNPRMQTGYIREPGTEYAYRQDGYTLEEYYALSDDQRMELIDGAFYVMEAPSLPHQDVIFELGMCIRRFIKKRKGRCRAFVAPIDVQLDRDDKTMVQLDIVVVCDEKKLTERCIYGAPDLVIEVLSESTRKKDMTIKLDKYRKAEVREYWMADIGRQRVITYFFEDGERPGIHGMEDRIPIAVFDGKLEIDFKEIYQSAITYLDK